MSFRLLGSALVLALSTSSVALAAEPPDRGGHDDATYSAGIVRSGFTTAPAAPVDGLAVGTSHDDAPYAPIPAASPASRAERASERMAAADCPCGHRS